MSLVINDNKYDDQWQMTCITMADIPVHAVFILANNSHYKAKDLQTIYGNSKCPLTLNLNF